MELCDFLMRVRGKKENVEEFIDVMGTDCLATYSSKNGVGKTRYDCYGNSDRHFWNINEFFHSKVEELKNGMVIVDIRGYCAYSVYSCMFDGQHTYQEWYPDGGGTTLLCESKKLKLEIEVYSSEPVYEFMEHYHIKNGELLLEEVIDYEEYYLDDYADVQELNECCGTQFTQEDWDNADDYISVGGIEWKFSI